MCRTIQEKLFDVPSHPRSILNDLEICIGGIEGTTAETAAEISLSKEMILTIGQWLGNGERVETLVSADSASYGILGEQLSEQLLRDGMRTH